MTKTAAQIETLAAWHAEQAVEYRKKQRRCRRADRKEAAAKLAAHHEKSCEFLRDLVGSLRDIRAAA